MDPDIQNSNISFNTFKSILKLIFPTNNTFIDDMTNYNIDQGNIPTLIMTIKENLNGVDPSYVHLIQQIVRPELCKYRQSDDDAKADAKYRVLLFAILLCIANNAALKEDAYFTTKSQSTLRAYIPFGAAFSKGKRLLLEYLEEHISRYNTGICNWLFNQFRDIYNKVILRKGGRRTRYRRNARKTHKTHKTHKTCRS